jgi:hypothetical protein
VIARRIDLEDEMVRMLADDPHPLVRIFIAHRRDAGGRR